MQKEADMTDANKILGFVLIGMGLATWVICLIAFVKVVFVSKSKGAKEILEQINALIRNWAALLKLLPQPQRPVFLLLAFGLILIGLGSYFLIMKPI
jgi:hypothetical protein